MNNIEIKKINKRYEGFSLNDVSFDVPKGAIVGFIGENGAGKSTTIKAILDLIKLDSGSVNIFGKPFNLDDTKAKEHIGVVIDECSFSGEITIKEIKKILCNVYKTFDSNKFDAYVDKFKLPTNKAIKKLSKGMQMKLNLLVALSHDSKILLLDEVTAGLDPMAREEILDEFLDFIQDEEKSILISSHIITDLEKICDYIVFIHQGHIVINDSKDSILDTYGIVRCSHEQFDEFDKKSISYYRKNTSNVEALVLKENFKHSKLVENATLEEIMVLIAKGVK